MSEIFTFMQDLVNKNSVGITGATDSIKAGSRQLLFIKKY
jgi:hypothetical protein